MVAEAALFEQLSAIANHGYTFSGDALSHAAVNECVRRGYAARDKDGDFIVTGEGSAYLFRRQKYNAAEKLRDFAWRYDEAESLRARGTDIGIDDIGIGPVVLDPFTKTLDVTFLVPGRWIIDLETGRIRKVDGNG